MALWCRDLPTVTVERSRVPHRVTFVYSYYENPGFFAHQVNRWRDYPAALRAHVSAIVVDDGSPEPARLPDGDWPFPIKLFRIKVDVRWNWLAARNIGMHHAPDGWCLLTDMDHVVPAETLDAIVHGAYRPDTVYCFQRDEHTGERIHPHSATFLLTRATFWRTGGYDEALSGHYGTDGDFRRRLSRIAPLVLTAQHVERWESYADASTARYLRKQPEDAGVHRLVSQRGPGWRPKALSFPYYEVAPQKEAIA